jgi:hypothetical protein
LSFESAFFGPGNLITWDSIVNRTQSKAAIESLLPFLDSLGSEVAILPRLPNNQVVVWYVLARTSRSARFARDELSGFLGPSFYTPTDAASSFLPGDPIDDIVRSEYGLNAFKLVVPSEIREAARGRLLDYLNLKASRPNRITLLVRTAGRILRDFEYALIAGDLSAALDRISELRNAGHLSATNLLFLEIRALGMANQWERIAKHPRLDALLEIQRPIRVTEALIKAIYHIEFETFESSFRPDDAVIKFRTHYSQFSELYKTRARMVGAEIDASFLLAALVSSPARNDVADEILRSNVEQPSTNLDYIRALHSLLEKGRIPTNDIQAARTAFGEGNLDQAYSISLTLPVSFDRTAILLRCAREMETLEASDRALDSVALLSPTDQVRLRENLLLSKIVDLLRKLRSPVQAIAPSESEQLPTDWQSWLERLSGSNEWSGVLSVAEAGSTEWSLETLIQDEERIRKTADLILAERSGWARTPFRDSLPFMIQFFTACGANPKLRSIYESLFLVAALDDQVSSSQAMVLSRLASVRMELGLTVSEYSEIVEQLSATFRALDSPSILDPLLDACEVLISNPCPAESVRLAFFSMVTSSLRRWYRRVDRAQASLFRTLCAEVGQDLSWTESAEPLVNQGEENVWQMLSGKKLALYSLKESAVNRAAALLKDLVGELKVDVFLDYVGGSPALKTAAQQADIFVIATAAAKHSASMFIESKRPKNAVTLYAQGQGTSSILRAISTYLGAGNSR